MTRYAFARWWNFWPRSYRADQPVVLLAVVCLVSLGQTAWTALAAASLIVENGRRRTLMTKALYLRNRDRLRWRTSFSCRLRAREADGAPAWFW